MVSHREASEKHFGEMAGSAAEVLTEFMRMFWATIRSSEFSPLFRLIQPEIHNLPDLAGFYGEEVVLRLT